ncbi:hypothetical protein IQ268_15680 [Oculatella sp. LEGE 06141]|uniref:hypothetical protein n=1 Tax=Oculatella sp. LEGE 06141 TaxID=1828648 RepID=UPI001880E902|nr:hypothetical protein [Oculatella sp. LEGE 06141]MBE9180010.1 hypothetical protein [Oculatella sp. LEGE 06141]
MEYLYSLSNASLVLRIVEHLHNASWVPVRFMTVIHRLDGWLVRIKLERPLSPLQDGNLRAFLNELGIPYLPEVRIQRGLWDLEQGQSPIETMRRYQIAVVSHGKPDRTEIDAFRQQFVQGLGYCPETLS